MNKMRSVLLLLSLFASALMAGATEQEVVPRVSIITSVYDGDEFIAGFMRNMVQQTIFDECELILIDANSPGNEMSVIFSYLSEYPNITYVKLEEDPGLYAVWNLAIKMAKAPLITNANLDDRRSPVCFEIQARALEEDESVDLVYSDYYLSDVPNDTLAQENKNRQKVTMYEFKPTRMNWCLPDRAPMWRKSLHECFGYFDDTFTCAGDWEFWNRVVLGGSQFKHVPGIAGVFYYNPKGISTDPDEAKEARRKAENQRVVQAYRPYWIYE